MTQFTVGDDITMGQAADYSAAPFTIVKLDAAAGNVVQATAGTDKIIGVISRVNTSTAVGAPINVHPINAGGTFKVVAGGTISIGDLLTATTAGAAIATTTGGNYVFGIAKEAAVTGQVFEYISTNFKV